jgi:hypothetical protein
MRWLLAAVVLGTLACGSTTPTAAVHSPLPSPLQERSAAPSQLGGSTDAASPSPSLLPSPTPSQTAAPAYAVLLDLFATSGSYNVALADGRGRVVARATAAQRTSIDDAIELPYISTSKSHVYFLDGDQTVRYLNVDGSTGTATTIAGGPRVHATFAVTPDDTRIAVGLLDYSVNPVRLTIYIEDLGGAHHAAIYSSTNHYVWPVAWHAGKLVVAYLGPNAVPFKSKTQLYSNGDLIHYPYGQSPYGGINFHVINPVTAVREAIISGGGASGLLSKAGTAVVQGDADEWSGNWINWNSPHDYGTFSAAGSLSPDGQMIAACCPAPGASGQLVIWYRDDVTKILPVTVTAFDWVGWLDNDHVVSGFYRAEDGSPSVVEISSSALTPIAAHGIVVAIFPGNLES